MIKKMKKFIGPPKPKCSFDEYLIITKIEQSEFPFSELRHITKGWIWRNCPEKVYKKGIYRINIFYSCSEYRYFSGKYPDLYLQRFNGFYKIERQICKSCEPNINDFVKLLVEFMKVSQTFRHKDLQEIRDFVIFKELL